MHAFCRFKDHGADSKRLQRILDSKCECHCSRKNCFQKFSSKAGDVQEFVQQFYSMDKLEQDEFDFW